MTQDNKTKSLDWEQINSKPAEEYESEIIGEIVELNKLIQNLDLSAKFPKLPKKCSSIS